MPSFDLSLIPVVLIVGAVIGLALWKPGIAAMGVGCFLFVQSGIIRADAVPATLQHLASRLDEVALLALASRAALVGLRNRRLALPAPLFASAGLALIGLLSMAFHGDSVPAGLVGIFLVSKAGLWLFVAANLDYDERVLVRYMVVIGALFVVVALVAVVQFAGVSLPWQAYVRRSGELAAPSIFSQHTVFGSSIAVAAGLAVVALRLPRARVQGLVLLSAAGVGVILSSVRRLLISLPMAAAVTLAAVPANVRHAATGFFRRRAVLVAIGLLVLVAGIIVAPRLVRLAADTWDEYVVHAADRDRYVLYRNAWELAVGSAPLGRGPGTFGSFASVLFNSPVYGQLGISLPDNLKMGAPYAMLLGEYGFLGLAAFAAFVVLTFRALMRVARQASSVLAVALATGGLFMLVNMTIESVVHQVFADSFISFFVFGGIGASLRLANQPAEQRTTVSEIAQTLGNWRGSALSLAGSLALILALIFGVGLATPAPLTVDSRPSIIVVMVNDLDVDLLTHLDEIGRPTPAPSQSIGDLIGAGGATFTNAFVADPVGAADRASFLLGQYAHNHGIGATDPSSAYAAFQGGPESATLATWLQGAGYRTGLVGQYMDGYGNDVLPPANDPARVVGVPPGWDASSWRALYGTPSYYRYRVDHGGALVGRGDVPDAYQTDVLAAMAESVATQKDSRPFFLVVAPRAPANGLTTDANGESRDPVGDQPVVAPRYAALYAGQPTPTAAQYQGLYLARMRAMASVEDMVASVIDSLGNRSDNTYLIFTSATGYHVDAHSLAPGSGTPYSTDVRVPLLVLGPGIQAGQRLSQLVSTVDLTATILDIAGVQAPVALDGRSLLPLLDGTAVPQWRTALPIEHPADSTGSAWRALRTEQYSFIAHSDGSLELYDMVRDPQELDNLAPSSPAVTSQLASLLANLATCSGEACFATGP